MNVRLNCLCWLSTEKSKTLTDFCSQSTAVMQDLTLLRNLFSQQSPLSSESQGKETLEVSTAAPVGHNCASRLCSHDVWRLEMSRCRQDKKHFDPGMIRPGCGRVVPCYPVRNKQLPMRHFYMNSKKRRKKRNPKGKRYRRHTGGTSVPQSDKIKAFFLYISSSLDGVCLQIQKGYCCTAVFFYRKGRSNILKPIYNMLDVSCAMKKWGIQGFYTLFLQQKFLWWSRASAAELGRKKQPDDGEHQGKRSFFR